jgi:hypothetical protein
MEPSDPLSPAGRRRSAAAKRGGSNDPARFKQFIGYFKKYLALGAVGCGVLPAPLSYFRVIPTFRAQYKFLTGYVTVFCFLALGFIFYSRHSIARWMFQSCKRRNRKAKALVAWLPLALIAASLAFLSAYHLLLQASINQAISDFYTRGVNLNDQFALENTPFEDIRFAVPLMISYLGVFLGAETAFAVMAIREYMQDILNLNDSEIVDLH